MTGLKSRFLMSRPRAWSYHRFLFSKFLRILKSPILHKKISDKLFAQLDGQKFQQSFPWNNTFSEIGEFDPNPEEYLKNYIDRNKPIFLMEARNPGTYNPEKISTWQYMLSIFSYKILQASGQVVRKSRLDVLVFRLCCNFSPVFQYYY